MNSFNASAAALNNCLQVSRSDAGSSLCHSYKILHCILCAWADIGSCVYLSDERGIGERWPHVRAAVEIPVPVDFCKQITHIHVHVHVY